MKTKSRSSALHPLPVLLPAALFAFAGCGGDAGSENEADVDAVADNPLYRPAELVETAPETFQARFETSTGDFVVEVTRAWAPIGADRFYNLVKNGYYDGVHFFRVMEGFMAQFGMHGDPQINALWSRARIEDDPVVASNTRGTITFAMGGPGTRTTQLFINFVDNSRLDPDGFAPFGTVIEGMDVVDRIHSGYGALAPRGNGPIHQNIVARGNEYLDEDFPELDHVVSATLVN
ncbi:MAG: peptidylprolyl isomerase [Gemmatimonadetes bacterium]|nr:peptidylprolyl isomerase [Gemmatimonadota bacterium]